jgi:serine/threonine protein kinase
MHHTQRYETLEKVAIGEQGQVSAGEDKTLGRLVALKKPNKGLQTDLDITQYLNVVTEQKTFFSFSLGFPNPPSDFRAKLILGSSTRYNAAGSFSSLG